ncbi:MAG: diguanylate cyclase [Bordetella sp.]|uniref:GGDEF domain-containing protein n=1 Tax=Bordetella sp. TaxID=28081 RepID=UPI003F7C5FF3
MSGILLLQALVYFSVLATTFYYRRALGLGVFFCVLGAMHFLETYLAAVYFIQSPFGLISPGSTILFSGKLAIFLLLYIKEDAENMRQPIYGLLAGNALMLLLGLLLRLGQAPASLPGYEPDLHFLDQMGLLMILGTGLLFVDLIALVILYEKLRATLLTRRLFGRIFVCLAIVLSVDQLCFFGGLRYLVHVPLSALYGGWIAKMIAAAFYSAMVTIYLRRVETDTPGTPATAPRDVFDRLTYRHRYEKLIEQVGRDALTGLQDRGQFDTKGPATLKNSADNKLPLSLLMIDIDDFKSINDQHGHPVGDRVIRSVVATILQVSRKQDILYRYGGEEFALLCLGLPHDEVTEMAEHIRIAVAGASHSGLTRPVTISIGVASFPPHASDFSSLLARADEALYHAKAMGRDTVYAHSILSAA